MTSRCASGQLYPLFVSVKSNTFTDEIITDYSIQLQRLTVTEERIAAVGNTMRKAVFSKVIIF
jgi:hypothetical protein